MAYSKSAIQLTGQVFGNLTALRRAGSLPRKNGGAFALWLCRCTCGQEVVCRGDKLRKGNLKSCAVNGHRWIYRRPATTAALTRSERHSWEKMWQRCADKKHKGYKNYGGRGITICERWKSFANFLEDMGKKPAPDYTIERIDVNGNYEKTNCRWAAKAEQRRNMRRSVYVELDGKRKLLIDVVSELGLKRSIVYGRLKNGWTLENALAVPVRQGNVKNAVSVRQGKAKYVMLVYKPTPFPFVVSDLAWKNELPHTAACWCELNKNEESNK